MGIKIRMLLGLPTGNDCIFAFSFPLFYLDFDYVMTLSHYQYMLVLLYLCLLAKSSFFKSNSLIVLLQIRYILGAKQGCSV